jgi:hypothetical protein
VHVRAEHDLDPAVRRHRRDPAAEGSAHTDAIVLRRSRVELPVHRDITPAPVEHGASQVLSPGLYHAR